MATSEYLGFVRNLSTLHDTERPVSVRGLRVAVENCRYACESAAQSRIKWFSMRAADELSFDATDFVTSRFYLLTVFPFDSHLHPTEDGAFFYRVRLAARAPQGSRCDFRLILNPADYPESEANVSATAAYTHMASFQTNSVTSAWLSEADGKTLLTVPADRIPFALRRQATVTAIGGSTETNVVAVKMEAQIWASVASTANTPTLTGLLVEEYVGP